MSDEHQRENLSNGSGTTNQAVEAALARMKAVWRAQSWSPETLREYRRVLAGIGEAELIGSILDDVIDHTEDRFPPPPGVFAQRGEAVRRRRLLDNRPVREQSWHVDEAALRDAIAFRDYCMTEEDREYANAAIRSIRDRLRARGFDVVDPRKADEVRFERADQKGYDPPDTLRLRVVQSTTPEDAPFPRGPRNGAGVVVAALAAVAVFVGA